MPARSPKKVNPARTTPLPKKEDPLLKIVDLSTGIPEVGTLVWARVDGSVFWPAFTVQEYIQPVADPASESIPPEYVSVIFMEKRYRAAKVKWSRVIVADLLRQNEQTKLITSLNRHVTRKIWSPNRAYKEGLKLWEQFHQVPASEREMVAEKLFEEESLRKLAGKKRSAVGTGDKSGRKRRCSEQPSSSDSPLIKKSDKLMRGKNRRYSLRIPCTPTSKLTDTLLGNKNLKEASSALKPDVNNNNGTPTAAVSALPMINKKTGRPLHGGALLKEWTQNQFHRVDKKFVFDSNPDLPCSKCKEKVPNESLVYCHEFPFHSECLLSVNAGKNESGEEVHTLKCEDCANNNCFICKMPDNTVKCSKCPLKFHRECLRKWPQAIIQGMQGPITCPLHFCHTCKAEERCLSKLRNPRLANNKAYRCIHCLSAYHKACLPAGCADSISGHAFIECPKHIERITTGKRLRRLGCFSCSKRLTEKDTFVECTSCYMIFHPACIGYGAEDAAEGISVELFAANFQCNNCCWGLFPLYGQVVWFQQPGSSFWPARILYPKESAVRSKENKNGLYSVVYFGSQSTYFDNVLQSVPFHIAGIDFLTKLNLYNEKPALLTAYEEAGYALTHSETYRDSLLPKPEPSYKKIDKNIYRDGKRVDVTKTNKEDAAIKCNCDQLSEPEACVLNIGCHNRDTSVECHKDNCSAPDKCKNRMFSLPNKTNDHLEVFSTENKGWGIKATRQISQGEFIIEYVGEVISKADMEWRVRGKHEEDPRYFLDLGANLYIDAEFVGNISRLINHSCDPNCATEKYNSLSRPVVGVFAKRDIQPGEELSFNYGYKKDRSSATFRCYCGADECKGFIGKNPIPNSVTPNLKRKREVEEEPKNDADDLYNNNCDICTFGGLVILCDFEDCKKVFHLKCVGLKKTPPGRWICSSHKDQIEMHKKRRKSIKKKTEVVVVDIIPETPVPLVTKDSGTPSGSGPRQALVTPKASEKESFALPRKSVKRAKGSSRRVRRKKATSLRNKATQPIVVNSADKEVDSEETSAQENSTLSLNDVEAVKELDQMPSALVQVTPQQEHANHFVRKIDINPPKRSNPRLPDRRRSMDSLRNKNSSILLRLLSRSSSQDKIDGYPDTVLKTSSVTPSYESPNLVGQLPPTPTRCSSVNLSRVRRSSPRVPGLRDRRRSNLRNHAMFSPLESVSPIVSPFSVADTKTEAESKSGSLKSSKDTETVNVLDQIAPSNIAHMASPISEEQSSMLSKRKPKLKRMKRSSPRVPDKCVSNVSLRSSRPLLLTMLNNSV